MIVSRKHDGQRRALPYGHNGQHEALPHGSNGQLIASSHASTMGVPDATGLDDGDDTQDQNEIPEHWIS